MRTNPDRIRARAAIITDLAEDPEAGFGPATSGDSPTSSNSMRTSAMTRGVLPSACLLCTAPFAAEAYELEAGYTADVVSNVSGGLEAGTRYLDNLDLMLEIDLEETWGGSGTLFVYGLYNNGSTFADELVGDLQVTSNIDAPEGWRIYELWYEAGNGPWSVRTGLYDLNSEFDVNETGALFLNSSHGIGAAFGQTGENGPSIFPVSSVALRAAVETDAFTARVAVLDGVPGDPDDPSSNRVDLGGGDGALVVAEVDAPLREGRLWGGYWRYTADFERPFGSGTVDGNDGWYIGAERRFELVTRQASAFVRYGRANDELNPLEDYFGAGIVVEGALSARPYDSLGLAVASAGAGDDYRRFLDDAGERAASRETTWELTWRAPINEHLVLQPDVQWVRNPAASHELEDAVVVGLRFELSW